MERPTPYVTFGSEYMTKLHMYSPLNVIVEVDMYLTPTNKDPPYLNLFKYFETLIQQKMRN